jgi:hypothetical protein
MPVIADMDAFRKSILDNIESLLVLRKTAEEYAVEPSENRGEMMVGAYNKFASVSQKLELSLEVLVKEAHGIEEPDGGKMIVATEQDNGFLIR